MVHSCTPTHNDTEEARGKKRDAKNLPDSRFAQPAFRSILAPVKIPGAILAVALVLASPLLADGAPAPDAYGPIKEAVLRSLAIARRGGPAEKAQPGMNAVERFAAALTEPNDESSWPLFKQISLDAPKEPWGEIGMAHVYVRWHLKDQAAQAFNRALALDVQNPVTKMEMAIASRVFGAPDAAKTQAEEILKKDPNDARARLLLAQLADDAGEPKADVQALYQKALDVYPDLYEARRWMAGVYEASGDKAGALEAVEALAQMNPKDLATQRKLAALRQANGDEAGAAKAWEACVALNDSSKETWSGLAAARRALRDAEGEEQALRRWHRIDPRDRQVIVRLFNLRAAAHDEKGMEEQAKSLLSLDPKDAGAHLVMAQRKAAANDRLGQLEELKAAINGVAHPEAKDAPERAKSELFALRVRLELPEQPLTAANPDGIYKVTLKHLTALYEEVRKDKPELQGHLAVQLKINALGSTDSVEVTEDTLHEPAVTDKLVAALQEGDWPKAKKSLTLKYELAPPQTHAVEVRDEPVRRGKKKAAEPEAPARSSDISGLAR